MKRLLLLSIIFLLPFESTYAQAQVPTVARSITFLVKGSHQATSLSRILRGSLSGAESVFATVGQPADSFISIDEAVANDLINTLEAEASPQLEQKLDHLFKNRTRPLSATERLTAIEDPSLLIQIREAVSQAAGLPPALEVINLGDFVSDTLMIKQVRDKVALRTNESFEMIPMEELKVPRLKELVIGRTVVIDGPVGADFAEMLYASEVVVFRSFDDFIREPMNEAKPLKLIFLASPRLFGGQNPRSVEKGIAKAKTIPYSVVIESREQLLEAIHIAKTEGMEPLVIFHNEPDKGILFEKAPMSLEEFGKLGVTGISCNTYEAHELSYQTTGTLDFESVVHGFAKAVERYSQQPPRLREFLEEFVINYNQSRKNKESRERIIYGGVVTAAATISIGGAILVKMR